MEDDSRKKETSGQPHSPRFRSGEAGQLVQAGQGNEPPKSPSPAEKLTWWNGREIKFADIMDL